MNIRKNVVLTVLALVFATLSAVATADRGHRHYHGHGGGRVQFGITLGAPLFYPGPTYHPYRYAHPYAYPYPYAYPAYPPTVIVPSPPRVYVQREDLPAAADTASSAQGVPSQSSPYWYYCRTSDTYYPYVRECAQPWERLPARPVIR
jgi:hypothetical protein